MGDDATLHCPDFSEDITLRKTVVEPATPPDRERQP
jgi:hypothetical protein